jgi:gamma-glutamylcyclotransferase (GGCT)/AIG2-like uncharacterized protein YtfP
MEYLAVYGSLMTSEGMLAKLGASPMVKSSGPAVLPGKLFDLGDFPGLIPGEGRVPGELFLISDPAVIPLLDEYEACHPDSPASSLFVRQRLKLIEPPVEAWVYLYAGSVENRRPIVGLTWPEYKAVRQGSDG